MACGNARREAYTAGGEATLWSLEILNVDAFVLIIAGAAPEAPLQARRNGSSGVRERPHSHGMARRGTWIGYNWGSIRKRMRTWVRLTTAMRTAEGKVWSQRQDVDPNNEQARTAAAAGLSFRRHRRLLPLDSGKILGTGEDRGEMQQSVVTANPLGENSGQ